MKDWDRWIGREEIRSDFINEGELTRWLATLDRIAPSDGSVPQAFHWCLCVPDTPTAALGTDGHPAREESELSFFPPIPLPRRMWAGSKVSFLKPIHRGQSIVRKSHIASLSEKHGGSGQLVFAEVVHEVYADEVPAVRETQTIVFREQAPAGTPPVPPQLRNAIFDVSSWHVHRSIVPSQPLLFRYSALTFNSHRIHYDLNYATQEEGYRGLVVQGPLTATLLLDLARQHFGDNALARFEFRGTSPAIVGEELHLVLREVAGAIELGAFSPDGRQVMTATAQRAKSIPTT